MPPRRGRLKALLRKAGAFGRLALNVTNAVADVNPVLMGVTGGIIAVQRRYDISKNLLSDLQKVKKDGSELGEDIMLHLRVADLAENDALGYILRGWCLELNALAADLDSLPTPQWLHAEENSRAIMAVRDDIQRIRNLLEHSKTRNAPNLLRAAADFTDLKDDLRALTTKLHYLLLAAWVFDTRVSMSLSTLACGSTSCLCRRQGVESPANEG
ncbi:hypothetical protein EXIGLDRAFT_736999 [Exidia glandulosa HHB12029]|uniref:Uncharacterized protein n=1 Tax=Exidia glandulosa HHB12029 TaxID=1314781 RepID=A0A166N2M9_EXIGL|nr:hypothetical protein EXIGLDRAFT_736999 [Exidia glandulosa HHB12029]